MPNNDQVQYTGFAFIKKSAFVGYFIGVDCMLLNLQEIKLFSYMHYTLYCFDR